MIGIGKREPESVDIVWIEKAVTGYLFERGFRDPDPILSVLIVGDVAMAQCFSLSLGDSQTSEFALVKIAGCWQVLTARPH